MLTREALPVARRLNEMAVGAPPIWTLLGRLAPFAQAYEHSRHSAVTLWERQLSLPSSVVLTDDECDQVIQAVRSCV
jgi:dTDP-4-amino-4,6-dideoxygalactose transaminase